jgi:hypothetical protein
VDVSATLSSSGFFAKLISHLTIPNKIKMTINGKMAFPLNKDIIINEIKTRMIFMLFPLFFVNLN